MATLEKIRSRSGLLLIIVGAALLAFIIGDFFQSGHTLFGPGNTLAKVGKQKIEVQEFQQRAQLAGQQTQGRKIDTSVLNQQVLASMIAEKLFNEEVERLGLKVTDEELTEAMLGRNSAMVDRMLMQNQIAPSGKDLYDIAFHPEKYGIAANQAEQYKNYWLQLEKQVEQSLLHQKFQNLFTGTLVANDLDLKAFYDENASTASVVYTKQDYVTLPDEEYEPTDAEVKALYDAEKKLYELPEKLSTVNYIAVDIVPSADDKLAAQERVENALMTLNTNPDVQGMSDFADFVVERGKQTKESLSAQIKAAVDTMPVGQAALVNRMGNTYTLAKVLGRSNEITDVTIDFMSVQANRQQMDSIIALLNNGADFDSIAANNAAAAQKDFNLSLLDPSALEYREALTNAATGRYFTPDTAATIAAGQIFRVNERKAPAEVVDLATITYEVLPSATTVNTLQGDLMSYVAAHKTAQEFADSAQAAGYTTFPAQVTPSSPAIGNIEDSHSAVAWVMDSKKGKVSDVFGDEQSGKFYAVAINNVYENYLPLTEPQVNATYTNRARNDKKAAALIEKYSGKANDVAGYANLMNASVDTTTVNFGQMQIPGIGIFEAEILGNVVNAEQGQLVGPVKGNNAVVVLQVTAVENNGRPFDAVQDGARYTQQRGSARMLNNMDRILQGNRKVENHMTTFYK